MAWTATLVSVDATSSPVRCTVLFTDGTRKLLEIFSTAVPLKDQAISRVNQLIAQDARNELTPGLIDLTPTTPPGQTPAQKYFALLGRIRALNDAINLGGSSDTTLLNSLKTQAVGTYDSSYF